MAERIYTTERLSEHISRTPEGFLLCEAVPINRTGQMRYHMREADAMPWLSRFEPDGQGWFTVIRRPEEVFRKETLESFQGKPFCVSHDGGLLTPANWADHAQGQMQNIRRGEGDQIDLTLADVLVTTEEAIELVLSGMREVSSGYDAEYVQLAPGLLEQINIVGNHLALTDRGRAGARCAIQDSEGGTMGLREKLKKFFAAKNVPASVMTTLDAMTGDEENDLAKESGETSSISKLGDKIDALVESDNKVHASLDALVKRLTKDADDEDERKKKEEEGTKKKQEEEKTEDWGPGCHTKDEALQDLASRAEILVPGFQVPKLTTDSKRTDVDGIKRDILKKAYATDEGRKTIERFTGANPSFDAMPRATLDAAFTGASELIGAMNNGRFARRKIAVTDFGKTVTPKDMNKQNADFWAGKKPQA